MLAFGLDGPALPRTSGYSRHLVNLTGMGPTTPHMITVMKEELDPMAPPDQR